MFCIHFGCVISSFSRFWKYSYHFLFCDKTMCIYKTDNNRRALFSLNCRITTKIEWNHNTHIWRFIIDLIMAAYLVRVMYFYAIHNILLYAASIECCSVYRRRQNAEILAVVVAVLFRRQQSGRCGRREIMDPGTSASSTAGALVDRCRHSDVFRYSPWEKPLWKT